VDCARRVPRPRRALVLRRAHGQRLSRHLRARPRRVAARRGTGGLMAEDVIQVQNQFYILSSASRAGERTAVLKYDDTFAVFDLSGDIGAFGGSEQGLYHEGTRYLSRFRLRVLGHRPLLLSSRVTEDNERFGADLTNPDIPLDDGERALARD